MKTRKLPQITVMNAALCLFVVFIHITFAPLSELIPKSVPHILIFAVNKSLGFCVPAFIFLSGFKLFKSYEERPLDIKRFFDRRFKKIVIPYFFAVLIYIFYFGTKGWLEGGFFKMLILGTVSAHFYYIVVLVQLYLLFPLVFRLFEKHSRTTFAVSLLLTLFCVIFLQTGYWDRFFGTYIFYFVLGMYWAKCDLYARLKEKLPKICIVYVLILIYHIFRLYLSECAGRIYEMFPVINMIYIVFAIIVFYAASEEVLRYSPRIMYLSRLIGKCSYSIYLYHLLVIFVLKYDILPHFGLSVKREFFVTTATVYALIAVYCLTVHFAGRKKE
ncbi:MAG: acyltransferase [Firmicutes bacterium]|nr:acyltransferase [Bacillota bacterium]